MPFIVLHVAINALGELIGVVFIEAVINCNEVDACMSASSEQLGMAVAHKYDCHTVTALPTQKPFSRVPRSSCRF